MKKWLRRLFHGRDLEEDFRPLRPVRRARNTRKREDAFLRQVQLYTDMAQMQMRNRILKDLSGISA
jgi:hypothetical protein